MSETGTEVKQEEQAQVNEEPKRDERATQGRFEMQVDAGFLRSVLKQLGCLVDECKVLVNMDGLDIKCIDPAHVAMVKMHIDKDDMMEYRVEEIMEAGIDISRLDNFLTAHGMIGRVKNDEKVTLIVDSTKDSGRKVETKAGQYYYKTFLIDTTGMSDPKMPNLHLPGEIVLPDTSSFLGGLRFISRLSDHVHLSAGLRDEFFGQKIVTPMSIFHLSAVAEKEVEAGEYIVDGAVMTFKGGVKEGIAVPAPDKLHCIMPIEYLTKIVATVPAKTRMRLRIGDDYPIQIDFSFGFKSTTTFLLAPRIESSD